MPLCRLLRIPLAATLMLAALGPASFGPAVFGSAWAADVKLIETVWLAQSPDCPIRQIKLHDFGRAEVYAAKIGSDGATWYLDPPVLHIYFDTWNGNLDGQIIGGDDFQATYFWRSDETLTPSSMACPFKPQP
ncbi:MAG TPA: hypothetical protein VFA91_13825 [Candidatus Polarisedimenticolia bacterium]|jgi:hypothetical protein|nr:hypothetical protein [Candidatus Polarisedimenticolia bacterium]